MPQIGGVPLNIMIQFHGESEYVTEGILDMLSATMTCQAWKVMTDMSTDSEKSLGVENELVALYSEFLQDVPELRKEVTFQNSKKMEIHNWFQYTQGFSPGLLGYYVEKWGINKSKKLLDPFVGSGTSLLFSQFRGIPCEGWDISPLAVLLSESKTTSFIEFDRRFVFNNV